MGSVKKGLWILENKGVKFDRVGRSAPLSRRLRHTEILNILSERWHRRKKCAAIEAIETITSKQANLATLFSRKKCAAIEAIETLDGLDPVVLRLEFL